MQWADYSEKRRVYHVRQQQSRKHGMGTTKTESSEAEIPVTKVLLDALREHRNRQAPVRLKKKEKWQDNGLIFATVEGHPAAAQLVLQATASR